MKEKAIDFFIHYGGNDVYESSNSYFEGTNGICNLVSEKLNDNYGIGLDLILFCFFIDGSVSILTEEPKLSNYSRKEKSIAVNTNLRVDNFHRKTDFEKKTFIVEEILLGLSLVKTRLSKNKEIVFNFDFLIEDFKNISKIYLC